MKLRKLKGKVRFRGDYPSRSQIGLGTVDFSIENTGLHNVSTPVEPLTSAK